MKKFVAGVIAFVVGLAVAVAHEPSEHGNTEGIWGLKPEFVHILINPLPVYGL